jgi:nitroreductase
LHGAHALGYSAILLSGNKVQASQLKSAFDLAPHDKLIGFITIGTANPEMIKPPREFITPYLNEWANSPTNSKA